MRSEQRINRQGRAFIEARMPHARQPGGAIDRGQHRDNVFLVARGRRETLVNGCHWMAASIISRCGRAMSISRGVHVLKDAQAKHVNICTVLDSTLRLRTLFGYHPCDDGNKHLDALCSPFSSQSYCVLYNIDETRGVARMA